MTLTTFILAAALQAQAYTLGSAVDSALGRSPHVQGAGLRVEEAESALREVRMKRLPSLTANSAFTRGNQPVYVFGTLMTQESFTQANFDIYSLNHPSLASNFRNSFDVGVPLFTGFELQSHERLGKLGREAAASGQKMATQNTRYAVVESFLQILLQKEQAKALAERIASSEQEAESARRLKERGLVLGSDYYAALATLAGLKMWQTRVNAGLEAAKARLATLLGVSSQALEVQGALSDKGSALAGEAELAERALQGRPELRMSEAKQDMASVLRRQAGLSLSPKVEAFASLETDTKDFDRNPWNRIFGVRASIPFGDPGYLPRRSKAQAALEASRAELQGMKENVGIEVLGLYQAYKGAQDSLPLSKDMLEKARQSLELFRPLYREGRQSIMEVLRAEDGLAKAQAAYLETLFQVQAGRARLLLASGSLDDQAVRDMEKALEVVK